MAFAIAAALAATAAVAFAAFMALQPAPPRAVAAVDNSGQLMAALMAAAACAWAGRVSLGRNRLAWSLLAISAAAFAAGQMIYSSYVVVRGVVPPVPSAADVGFLLAAAFAVVSVAAFSTRTEGASNRLRLTLDGAIIVLALTFIAWALGLKHLFLGSGGTLGERSMRSIYPAMEIILAAIVILVLRGVTRQQQGRMAMVLGGLVANIVATSAFVYHGAGGAYGLNGSEFDTGWVIGYLMIALAAIWPEGKSNDAKEGVTIDVWQLMLPWFAVIAAAVVAVVTALQGHQADAFMSTVAGLLGALLMTSQALAHNDSRKLLAASRQSEATLAEVIAQAPAGVVRISTDLCISEASPRFGELLSIGAESQVGAPITGYFEPAEGEKLAAALGQLCAGRQSAAEADIEYKRPDGVLAWLHWSATRVSRPDGRTEYLIVMFADTTSRHQAEIAATASLAVLERLNSLKSDFLHNVSHEFKTALTGIQGFSEFMRDSDQLNMNDARAFAADIYRDAARLDQMVVEMLDLDRVETTRATLRVAPVDLNALIRLQVQEASRGLDGITIAVSLDPALPQVTGDSEKLSGVIKTLLDNAAKYSPDSAEIAVTSRIKGVEAEVIVKDRGTGVRADFDKRLFGQDDLYADSPIRKVVGTGLGLGMARQVIEMHGGRIWVDRVEDGSEFHFAIPVTPPHSAAATIAVAVTRVEPGQPVQVA